jgi:hypothetical protein
LKSTRSKSAFPFVFKIPQVFIPRIFGITACVVFLFSCATSPKPPETFAQLEQMGEAGEFAFLPPGAAVYLWANVKQSRSLLDALSFGGFNAKDAVQILDRTDTAAAAFFKGPPRFFFACRGNYPNLRAGISMTFSRDWTRVKSPSGGGRYWHSPAYGLGLVLGSKSALASGGDPLVPNKLPPADIPAGFSVFRAPFSVAGWVPGPQEPLNKFLASQGIPIQIPAEDFFFGASAGRDEGAWELVFRVRTRSVNQARALVSLFSLARLAVARGGKALEAIQPLFVNLPVQDGDSLTLRSAPVDEKQAAALFAMAAL